jgi:transposase InsO family protein
MTVYLRELGYRVNRKRVQRLMRELGIEALYPKPRMSKANLAHQVYPYLLRDLTIESANQVWCTDITYFLFCEDTFIWWRSWIGIVEKYCHGEYRIRWM